MAAGGKHLDLRLSSTFGETVTIYYPDRVTIIDRIAFPSFTGLPNHGQDISMGRLPDAGTNIVYFPTNFTSLGGPNKYQPITNLVISEILTHTDPPLEDAIELQNISPTNADISGWWISNNEDSPEKFRIPAGTTLAPGGFKVFYAASSSPGFNRSGTGTTPDFTFNSAHGDFAVLTAFLPNLDLGGVPGGYRVSRSFGAARNGVSFGRYVKSDGGTDTVPMSKRSFGADTPATVAEFRTGTGATNAYPLVGPLVISEIMYQPPNVGTNDNKLDEFVELSSITNGPLRLFFYDPLKPVAYQTNTWHVRGGITYDFPTNVIVPALGRVLLVNFDPLTHATQLAAFRSLYALSPDVPVFGPYSGALNNDSDTIELALPDYPQEPPHPDAGFVPYVLVEKVKYEAAVPWPTNVAATGWSLQRIALSGYANDQTNWLGASPTAGRANDTNPNPDSDGDGLPDSWEIQYFGSISDPRATADGDPDADGFSNLQEYVAGTSPVDTASLLKIDSADRAGGTTTLRFTAVAGKTYSVVYSVALGNGAWLKLKDVPAQATTGPLAVTDSAADAGAARFYRIVTPASP